MYKPMAEIGWIDFSKSQKDKALAVLATLKPEGRVDELGVGIVRDALADLLFPGLSTVQTRAKYFYIVPYILWEYMLLPSKQKSKTTLAKFLEEKEKDIMYSLTDAYERAEGHGVIGITKQRGEGLKRYPSEIYWSGLNTFGFVRYNNYSLGAYLSRFSRHDLVDDIHFTPAGDDEPADDAGNDYNNNMGLFCPNNANYQELESLDMSGDEAEDFRKRILSQTPYTLLAECLRNPDLLDLLFAVSYEGREGFVAFAPQAVNLINNEELLRKITLSHDFSLVMYGAHITYNQAVQRVLNNEGIYDETWEEWRTKINSGLLHPDGLTIEALYEVAPQMRSHTMSFLTKWLDLVKAGEISSEERFSLVERQEYHNKKHKARLRRKNLDVSDRGKWIGFDYLDFRFNNAKTILKDIQNAL